MLYMFRVEENQVGLNKIVFLAGRFENPLLCHGLHACYTGIMLKNCTDRNYQGMGKPDYKEICLHK